MAVLLGSPGAGPVGPGGVGRASLVAHAVQGVEHGHVGGQCLLSDHVAHKHHQVVVGQVGGALAQVAHLQAVGWVRV